MSAFAARATASRNKPSAAPRVGRPPRVDTQAIIAAALEIGLEKVTLKQIADRLGVAQATLYRHVHNRDELVRLAAFQLTLSRRLPDDAGAHWSVLATRYAETLYESFVAEPQLINELLRGRLGPDAEIDVIDQFLGRICAHGFSLAEGAQLFHAMGTLAIGAAAGAIAHAASRSGEVTPWDVSLRRALAERDRDELPRVRQLTPQAFDLEPSQWLLALRALLAGFAAARGETLPPAPSFDTAATINSRDAG